MQDKVEQLTLSQSSRESESARSKSMIFFFFFFLGGDAHFIIIVYCQNIQYIELLEEYL